MTDALVEEYRKHYNERRPHSSLGYRTLAEFAVSCEPGDMDTAFYEGFTIANHALLVADTEIWGWSTAIDQVSSW